MAFDGLVDSFEATHPIRHGVGELFEDIAEVLEIAADEKLRLTGCDIEWLVFGVDGVGDLLYV